MLLFYHTHKIKSRFYDLWLLSAIKNGSTKAEPWFCLILQKRKIFGQTVFIGKDLYVALNKRHNIVGDFFFRLLIIKVAPG